MSLVWEALLLLPLGIIGLIRWSSWIIKKLIGTSYRPDPPVEGLSARVSVIAPVYMEDPDVFRMALQSWVKNQPHEIVAVIDHADKACEQVFREVSNQVTDVNMKLIVTAVPGKRPALADGVRASSGEIVALVDSDTRWDPESLPSLVAPFADAAVGGVTCRQNVQESRALSQKLTDLLFDLRYVDEMQFLGKAGQGFSCLSGRTAIYRRSAILPVLDDMVNETFRGKQVISGEDKRLTYLVQSQGHQTRYQANVTVYTAATTSLKTFLKQKVRWTRNSWRADLRALGQAWVWKRPALAFFLIEKCLSGFTVLIAPMIWGIAVYLGFWPLVFGLPVWWLASRAVKAFPYLKRRPRDFWMVPIYVISTFVFGVIRLYALVTLNHQGWLTRGASRGTTITAIQKTAHQFRDAVLTTGLLSMLLAGVVAYSIFIGLIVR